MTSYFRFIGYWQYSSLLAFLNQLHNISKKHAIHVLLKIGENSMTTKKDEYHNMLKKGAHLFVPVHILLRIITRSHIHYALHFLMSLSMFLLSIITKWLLVL